MSLDWSLLILYVGLALSISFLCSILEATLLSARITELIVRKEKKERGAAILLEFKQEHIDEAISAILTLNTIAHTIGAAMAGAQAAIVFGDVWVGVFSAVLTLLVLVVTEIIPKTIGTVFAPQLTGFVGRTIRVLTIILWPVLQLTNGITRLINKNERVPISRSELNALVGIATREGTLEQDESTLIDNVLRLEQIRIEDVMTPRTVAVMLPVDMSVAGLLDSTEADAYSRVPLFRDTRDQVVGYVLLRDVLSSAARHCNHDRALSDFMRDCWFVPEDGPLSTTLRQFLKKREHIAVVVNEFGGVVGLVTLEDLIETVLGVEIVDERDQAEDLRARAIQLRDERLERMRKQASS